jgi:co-chaperonin GroES (HSP10)
MPTAELNGESTIARADRCARDVNRVVLPRGIAIYALRDPADEMQGVIHLPNQAQRIKTTATIVAVGPDAKGVSIGQRVILLGGYKVELVVSGWKLEIVSEDDIGGVIVPGAEL